MHDGSKESISRRIWRVSRWTAAAGVSLMMISCGTKPVDNGIYPPPLIPESTAAPKPKGRPTPASSLRVGDTLEVFVDEDEAFNGIYKIREGGDIIIPKVGRIPVAGMSVSSARAAIERELESSQLTKATVIADRIGRAPEEEAAPADDSPYQGPQTRKILVYITGKVNRPGQHVLTLTEGRMIGVYEAILIAGGMSRFGYAEKVHVMRADKDGMKHRIPVNVRLIEEGKAADPPVGHGDVIVVPEKVFGTAG